MDNIPQHIIDLFRSNNSTLFPCISYIEIPHKDILTKLFSKSEIIWYYSNENQSKKILIETYLVYDKTGIDIYYKLNEKKIYQVFILSKIEKRDIVDFTLHYIKKQIKEYGNNSKTVTGEDQ